MENDGYLDIGDVGYLDHDGFLYLNDRSIDMIISGGVNIYPAEIEACLLELDGVRDRSRVGIPDEEFGEAIAAHVEATGPDRRRSARTCSNQSGALQNAQNHRVRQRSASGRHWKIDEAQDPRTILAVDALTS